MSVTTSRQLAGPRSTGLRARRFWFAAAAGIALGLIAYVAVSRAQSARATEPADLRAPVEARRLLACYSLRLGELAAAADQFSRATIDEIVTFEKAARPVAGAIEQANKSFIDLADTRPAVTAGLLRSPAAAGSRDALICALQRAESYNWNRMRPRLNALAVNVVAVWRHGTDPVKLERIHRQQLSGWLQLAELLRQGADDFAQEGVAEPCSAQPP
jgi:hypothetical protein